MPDSNRKDRVPHNKSPREVIDLVVDRLRHTVLPAIDTVSENTGKIRSGLVVCGKSLNEIAEALKEVDPEMYDALLVAADAVSDASYLVRKLKDDLSDFVSNQVRGQATALARLNNSMNIPT